MRGKMHRFRIGCLAGILLAGLCLAMAPIREVEATGLLIAPNPFAQKKLIVDGMGYRVTGDGTVTLYDLFEVPKGEVLEIPAEILSEGETYTVTSVEMELTAVYPTIREIRVPSSVTGQVKICRRGLAEYLSLVNDDPWSDEAWEVLEQMRQPGESHDETIGYQALPALERVSFAGEQAPIEVSVEKYLTDGMDLIYEVPEKCVEIYRQVIQPAYIYKMAHFDDWEGMHSYEHYPVPVTLQETGTEKPEVHYFENEDGIYVVKEEAGDGVGKVALIRAKQGITVYETDPLAYMDGLKGREKTLASEIEHEGYQYVLDELTRCSLLDFFCDVFTMPDTVTTLNPECMPRGISNFIFVSKNVTELPARIMLSNEDYPGVRLLHAPGVIKIDERAFSGFSGVHRLVVAEGAQIPAEMLDGKGVKYIEQVKLPEESAEIRVPDSLELYVGETARVNAMLSEETGETLQYMNFSPYANVNRKYMKVSKGGKVLAKRATDCYVLVYSLESGAHEYIKVEMQKKTFRDGIYTYAINFDQEVPKVTILRCEPTEDMTTLVLPSQVTYEGVTYKVKRVDGAEKYVSYARKLMYCEKELAAFIPDEIAAKSKIRKIVVPAGLKGAVILAAKLPELEEVEIRGKEIAKRCIVWMEEINDVMVTVPRKIEEQDAGELVAMGEDWDTYSDYGLWKQFRKNGIKERTTKK